MKSVDDARRAWEAAKRISAAHEIMQPLKDDARLLLTNATSDYAQALIDAAERRFDALGIKVGETTVIAEGVRPFVIGELVADVPAGRVKAWSDSGGGWTWADELRPYTALEAKQMVLNGTAHLSWGKETMPHDTHRLTLSNVTPADLDAMTGPITGTYTLEKLK